MPWTLLTPQKKSAVLIGINRKQRDELPAEESMKELAELARTAGATVIKTFLQHKTKPDPKTYIGSGKLKEILTFCETTSIDFILIDGEIAPSQQRNLEQLFDKKILDRTALILDIFSKRARTHEAKLQVELAQLEYYLPRLTRLWTHLSRLGGGIGTRGPGETQLEIDRRRIRERMKHLKKEIEKVRSERKLHRAKRRGTLTPAASLIGYTNAGKSTLMNRLTQAGVPTEDKLFATLDPLTRKLILPNQSEILVSDTVGFIQKLPHQLVDSFHATLEEVAESDLLIHVIDASHPEWEKQVNAVYRVLEEIGATQTPLLTVFNKMDLLTPIERKKLPLEAFSPAVLVSAASGENIPSLLKKLDEFLKEKQVTKKFIIPYQKMNLVSWLHQKGKVKKEAFQKGGVHLTLLLHPILARIAEKVLRD